MAEPVVGGAKGSSSREAEELTRSVEGTLLREARLLEVRLAYVRGITTALAAGIAVLWYLLPRQTIGAASIPAGGPLLVVALCVIHIPFAQADPKGCGGPWEPPMRRS